ncbi:MAG: hypothetical protein AMJ95_01305 [Omnitrophica WOR_2 bacterium SM23_72]|nr:MAG: hypothetical protein AMJ95_01305 [Omnitrophica WOR_2 bacterium SM23_72]
MHYRAVRFGVILLFFINLFAGFIFINEGLFHYDAVCLARAVEDTLRTGHLQPAARGRYGSVFINTFIALPFFLMGQDADLATRLSSVLFHASSIAMLFLLVYELFGDFLPALFSGLLFSFVPFYFSPNTYGKEHGMSIFFVLLSFYLLRRGQRRNSYLLMGLSSFFLGFSVSVKESVVMASPLYFLLYFSPQINLRPFGISVPKDKFRWKSLVAVGTPFLIIFAILYSAYLKDEFFRELFIRDLSCAEFLGPCSFMLKQAFKDLGKSIPPVLFLFSGLGAVRLVRKNELFLALFLCLWFTLIFFFGNLATYGARYLDIVVIPALLLAAYSLSALFAKDKLMSLAILIYFVMSMFLFLYPTVSFRHRYNGEKQFAELVRQITPKNALIITMDDAVFIEYYGERKTLTHPVDDRLKIMDFVRTVAVHLVNKTPVYVTESSFSYDHKGLFWEAMMKSFKFTHIGSRFCEDYHRPELDPVQYQADLFKLDFLKP